MTNRQKILSDAERFVQDALASRGNTTSDPKVIQAIARKVAKAIPSTRSVAAAYRTHLANMSLAHHAD